MVDQTEQDRMNAEHRAECVRRTAETHGRLVLTFDEAESSYDPNEVRLAPASEDKPERYVIHGWNEGGYNFTSVDLEPALKQIAANKELADWLPTVGIELRLGEEMAKKDTALIEQAFQIEKFRNRLDAMHRRAQNSEGLLAKLGNELADNAPEAANNVLVQLVAAQRVEIANVREELAEALTRENHGLGVIESYKTLLADAEKKNRALGRDLDAVFVAIGDAVWGGGGSPVNVETAVEDIKELEGRTRASTSKIRQCPIQDEYCPVHDFVHGKEADELREGVKRLVDTASYDADEHGVPVHALADLLDKVDARDSVAWVEASKKKDERKT